MYKKVELKNGFVGMENEISKFWKDNDIKNKNFNVNEGKEYFTFYDGPPTANGKPHVGHILTRVIKDIIPRYKVMKGYNVIRKAGWDTHGLPVELEIEKKLGISGKDQIEKYGVENFIKECKNSVFSYVALWEKMSDQVAYWVDMENPYVTYHNTYIESVWWALKQMWNKNLLYEGHKVMPYCPRCGTALSSHEVAQGYKDVKDTTAIVKFKLIEEDKYVLAWTTTPWTLPSNLALCVNKAYDYVEVKYEEEIYILAKDLVAKVFEGKEVETINEFKGEKLLGKSYERLLPFGEVTGKAFEIIHGDYVTLTDGTGIVHIAPAYGEDDSLVAKQNGIGFINLVDKAGRFVDEVEIVKGKTTKEANPIIIEYLKNKNSIFKTESYLHSYPHCWRCDTPLLYYPKESWFVQTTKIKDRLLKNNSKINWMPETIKTGRFGKFLDNVIDWGISRDRYWGTPLNIWNCECGHKECIGSIEELKEKATTNVDNIELHKPYIDNVKLKCDKCGKEMTRTKEVIDCWFDSGCMSFAQHHYPFENKEIFEKNFPANFISEAVDQTRGWFYTSLAVGTAVFDKSPYENCIVLGHVLDKKGLKMSKSKGNVVDPIEVMDKTGADAVRWHFYTASAPWLPTRFSIEDVEATQRRFEVTLWNVYSFYTLYANIDKFNPDDYSNFESKNVLDKWLLSKLNTLIEEVDNLLEKYDITNAAITIESFVDELSNWYVRRSRERFWKEGLDEDKIGAYTTLYTALKTVSLILAPFTPYISEEIYQNLVYGINKENPESVHLCKYPEVNKKYIDHELEKEMDLAYSIVKLGRSVRNMSNIKNRQPLSKMLVSTKKLSSYYIDIIKEELNIKEIELAADISKYVSYEIKPNLPVLGRQFGKYIPQIKTKIAEFNQMELATNVESGKIEYIEIDDNQIELSKETLLITMTGLEGYASASLNDIGVVLDTNITTELMEEGYIRELLSKVQNMRKENNFELLDRINIYIKAEEYIKSVVLKYEETIKKETLTNNIIFNEDKNYTEISLNDKNVQIFIER